VSQGRAECATIRPAFDIADPSARAACHFEDEARALAAAQAELPPAVEPPVSEAERGVLLAVDGLVKTYASRGGGRFAKRRLRAVDTVSFAIRAGESLGLVGESGSGKSTVARALLGLAERDAGAVTFEGEPLNVRRGPHRGRLQMVFQDPGDSLNPLMSVEQIVAEPLTLLEHKQTRRYGARVTELLDLVGLAPEHRTRRPVQLSGGQRQRVAIARALSTDPALVVCDEAVSSLDVSVRAQILNLLMDLQRRLGLSYLFISHDLSVVRHVCDRVAVMYGGRFVEVADADRIFTAPQHPYTIALLSAVPVPDPGEERRRSRIHLVGELPDLTQPMEGCIFRSRCWKPPELAATVEPPLVERVPGHLSACHEPENVA